MPRLTSNLRPAARRLPQWLRGGLSTLGLSVAWGGRFCGSFLRPYRTTERYTQGLVIVLPGIESESFLNHSVAWGLVDGGWQGAIEVDDWTTSFPLFFLYHLRSWQRNRRQAQRIADRIVAYQDQYPGSPVHVIGHSGGGALTILILEALPADRQITSAILLAAAIGPKYPLQTALSKVEHGIWNFWSPLDCLFLGASTLLLGTIEGRHCCAAGMVGFQVPSGQSADERSLYQDKLHQQPYTPRMARTFNFGGHFGWTNRAFVEDWIAPLICKPQASPSIRA
jgi:pimeloyl-ACP methyl ester carboxylesterase